MRKTQIVLVLTGLLMALTAARISRAALDGDPDRSLTPAAPAAGEGPNCRYGAALVPRFMTSTPWLDTLGVGWYMNFEPYPFAIEPAGADLARVVRVDQARDGDYFLSDYKIIPPLTEAGLGRLVRQHPGELWLIGNEPDVNNAVQDATFPEVYARAYHDAYQFIKAIDPTAQVANGALSMITPARLQYLSIVWDTYQRLYDRPMPVDTWNMHLYILAEGKAFGDGQGDGKIALGTDPALAKMAPPFGDPASCPNPDIYCRAEHDSLEVFAEQVTAMRVWMKERGQQYKPLILSEVGSLYSANPTDGACAIADEFGACFTPERAARFLLAVNDYLESAVDPEIGNPLDGGRLVQQWSWYSLVTEPYWSGGTGNLVTRDYASYSPGNPAAFTVVGRYLHIQLANRALAPNLQAVPSPAQWIMAETNATTDLQLRAWFVNNGNTTITRPFTVTFYRDSALTQPIGSTIVHNYVRGCVRRLRPAMVVWHDVPPGRYEYWVKVDSGGVIAETDESAASNVTSGLVTIFSRADVREAYLPMQAYR